MTIPQFFVPDVRPQLEGGQIPQYQYPDFGETFLKAMAGAQHEAGLNSRSSAELAAQQQQNQVALGHLKLAQLQEQSRQHELDMQHTRLKAEGDAYNTILEHLVPHMAATGQLGQMVGGGQQQQQPPQQPPNQFGIPQGLPFQLQGNLPGAQQQAPGLTQQAPAAPPGPQGPAAGAPDPFQALSEGLKGVDSEAIPGIMEHIRPFLEMMNPEAKLVSVGDRMLQYFPGKGLFDPQNPKADKNGFVQSEDIKPSQEQLLKNQLLKEQIQANQVYRQGIQGQAATKEFDTVTSDLRKRASLLNQANLTLQQARFSTNPEERRTLTSAALTKFVQASDQSSNLRQGMLMWYKKTIDQSFKGTFENMTSLLASGRYPDKLLGALQKHLTDLTNQSQAEFTKLRQGQLRSQPWLEPYLRRPEDIYLTSSDNFGAGSGSQPPTGPVPPPP